MKRYEVIFIAHSDLSKDEIDGLIDRYKDIVVKFKGTVVKVEKWGVRKLAYRIEKQPKGFYALMDFVGEAATVSEVERNFKFDDKVLKYLTVKKSESVDMSEIEKEISGQKEEKPEEPKPEAKAAPSQDAQAAPSQDANAAPSQEAKAAPSQDAQAAPSQDAKAAPSQEESPAVMTEAAAAPSSEAATTAEEGGKE